MSGDGHTPPARLAQAGGLKAHDDARAITRLFQCSQCSHPIREPMTLPCGNSLCRKCLPPLYKRENVTYPLVQGRSEGFICSFKDCGLEHSLADCSLDITLSKLMDVVNSCISTYKTETSDTPLLLDERLRWRNVIDSSMDVMPRSRVLHGGRIISTYTFMDMGELNYHSEVSYTPVNLETSGNLEALDVAVLENLKEVARNELECLVCYTVMLDPLTTSCGHTFCRQCVVRVLDHSNLCPVCRRRLPMASGVQGEPTNKRISYLLEALFHDVVVARLAQIQEEDRIDQDAAMALFPCTAAYPQMPTFLHIFEPRYRLMIRRAIQNGSSNFGILLHNQMRQPQGNLGIAPFTQYGTILHIDSYQMLPDGRSLIETKGLSRFRVIEYDLLDGYYVGRIQRIEDIPIAEEEAIEARETSGPAPADDDPLAQIGHMSTQRLLEICLEFTAKARARSARWLTEHVLSIYGQPPTDPALFPYWFACVLPIQEEEKYQLLPATSVRARLKIAAQWVHRLEAARCEQLERLRAMMERAAAAREAEIHAQSSSPSTQEGDPTAADEASGQAQPQLPVDESASDGDENDDEDDAVAAVDDYDDDAENDDETANSTESAPDETLEADQASSDNLHSTENSDRGEEH